ncbi:Legumain [Hypsibius exemplaris]|uniref:legumain n=1 Tax=Hypsibius exemplaris TaxID=2072580 RepID=A0A1W0WKI7_HYPEX|nr:Legumain [Hypsibius exemplaris]
MTSQYVSMKRSAMTSPTSRSEFRDDVTVSLDQTFRDDVTIRLDETFRDDVTVGLMSSACQLSLSIPARNEPKRLSGFIGSAPSGRTFKTVFWKVDLDTVAKGKTWAEMLEQLKAMWWPYPGEQLDWLKKYYFRLKSRPKLDELATQRCCHMTLRKIKSEFGYSTREICCAMVAMMTARRIPEMVAPPMCIVRGGGCSTGEVNRCPVCEKEDLLHSKMLLRLLMLAGCVAATLAVVFPPSVNRFLEEQQGDLDAKNDTKLWVLIVAGSNGFYNYRHQADAYHAYQIMKRHGLPDEQIILMHFDDIAHDPENPTPGIVINHPNGSDVYKGVLKDYTGATVTAPNFLNILSGNAKAMKGIGSGRVINSRPQDHIFVNFVDHGAPGLVAFPSDELSATDLNAVIKKMYKAKRFAKMLFYVEACESGSMFENLLPKNINVFATTAANAEESSYACYYDDLRQTYLGDVYSVNWMEDTDEENLSKETIQTQFELVKGETNTSHVEEYGDLNLAKLVLGEFFGGSFADPIVLPKASKTDAVPSEQVYMKLLAIKVEKATSKEERHYWSEQIRSAGAKRSFLTKTLVKIANAVADNPARSNVEALLRTRRPIDEDSHECLAVANKFFSKTCFSLAKNEFALFNAPRLLANACMDGVSAKQLVQVMQEVCTHQPMTGIH